MAELKEKSNLHSKSRLIVVINLLRKDKPEEVIVKFEGVTFTTVTHHIGWDFQLRKPSLKNLMAMPMVLPSVEMD